MGTRSPEIGYRPINDVVTLRAEPHIRLDNKLWTVHGIWIFTKGNSQGKSVEPQLPSTCFRESVIYIIYTVRPFIYAFVYPVSSCTSAATLCELGKSNHTLSFFPVPAPSGQLHLHWNERSCGNPQTNAKLHRSAWLFWIRDSQNAGLLVRYLGIAFFIFAGRLDAFTYYCRLPGTTP
jgi:hypothetical protein